MKKLSILLLFVLTCVGISGVSSAANRALITKIAWVFVNGGDETVVPGPSCIQIAAATSCPANIIAIPEGNKDLLAASLTSKAGGNDAWVYYADSQATQVCPGTIATTCTLIGVSP